MVDPRLCPQSAKENLQRYAESGIPTGGFLQAVLENNLMEAVARADQFNLPALPHICSYIYNTLPMACHGSPKRVEEWLQRKAKERNDVAVAQKCDAREDADGQ